MRKARRMRRPLSWPSILALLVVGFEVASTGAASARNNMLRAAYATRVSETLRDRVYLEIRRVFSGWIRHAWARAMRASGSRLIRLDM